MDFILSLTHFCEVHGPTSILCTQVLPFSCPFCHPDSSARAATDLPSVSPDALDHEHLQGGQPFKGREIESSKPTNDAQTPTIEGHEFFIHVNTQTEAEKLNRYGTPEGDTCASCSFTLPEAISKKLPDGAPGSSRPDGKGRNGSPVLRSREIVHSCGVGPGEFNDDAHESHFHHYATSESIQSHSSDTSCHNHLITYLTLRGPPNPADYALLRRSSIRTLSCELLPRGLSSGPLSFGDAVAGYTIAYIFRLPDPRARGRRRSYALIAMAGRDAGRAFRACPLIWRAFGNIASGIVAAAERFQEGEKRREEGNEENKPKARNYTPVSSFLTGRTIDPDGFPRRAGQIRAKSLAEIVGNEYVFAEIHAQFVALLQQLGVTLGGLPATESASDNSPSSSLENSVGHENQIPRSNPVAVSTQTDAPCG